jgi:hypothetical protein
LLIHARSSSYEALKTYHISTLPLLPTYVKPHLTTITTTTTTTTTQTVKMKFSVAVIIATAVALVSAQFADLPSCAVSHQYLFHDAVFFIPQAHRLISHCGPQQMACAMNGLANTGCDLSDYSCICKNEDFIKSITSCIEKACSESDQESTLIHPHKQPPPTHPASNINKTETITFAKQLCASAGVTITSLTAHASSTGSATKTSSATGSETSPSATWSGSGAIASESSGTHKLVPGIGLGVAAVALLLL